MCLYLFGPSSGTLSQEIEVPLYVETKWCPSLGDRNHRFLFLIAITNRSKGPLRFFNFIYPRVLHPEVNLEIFRWNDQRNPYRDPEVAAEFFSEIMACIPQPDEQRVYFVLYNDPERPFRTKPIIALDGQDFDVKCAKGLAGTLVEFSPEIESILARADFTPFWVDLGGGAIPPGETGTLLVRMSWPWDKEQIGPFAALNQHFSAPNDIPWQVRSRLVSGAAEAASQLGSSADFEALFERVCNRALCKFPKQTVVEHGFLIIYYSETQLLSNLLQTGSVLKIGEGPFKISDFPHFMYMWKFGESLYPATRNVLCTGHPGPISSPDCFSRFSISFTLLDMTEALAGI